MTKNTRWWVMTALAAMWFVFWITTNQPEMIVISNMWIMGSMLTND